MRNNVHKTKNKTLSFILNLSSEKSVKLRRYETRTRWITVEGEMKNLFFTQMDRLGLTPKILAYNQSKFINNITNLSI